MNKIEYLKFALANGLHYKKAWVFSAFAVTLDKADNEQNSYIGKLKREPWGLSYLNEQREYEKIEGSLANEPLFNFKERVTADSTWAPNITEAKETSIGNLFFNALCIVSVFGSKFPYMYGKFDVRKVEQQIAAKLKDNPEEGAPRSTEYFYVDEYLKFMDSLQFLMMFTQISTWSATRKVITCSPELPAFKKAMLEKYKGKLQDPVELSKYEKELKDFDDKYMEGDPANDTFVAGKIKNVSRKKMYLGLGAEAGFGNGLSLKPITNSLHEGWSREPEQFISMLNGARAGSYGRGAETVYGGVAAKKLLRTANNFRIEDTDCGSKLGKERQFFGDDISKLVGRYVVGATTKVVDNLADAGNYLGKKVTLRSPMYCTMEGDSICKICAGRKLGQFPTGVTIALTEVSAIILASSMAAMHGKVLSTAKLRLKESFT